MRKSNDVIDEVTDKAPGAKLFPESQTLGECGIYCGLHRSEKPILFDLYDKSHGENMVVIGQPGNCNRHFAIKLALLRFLEKENLSDISLHELNKKIEGEMKADNQFASIGETLLYELSHDAEEYAGIFKYFGIDKNI